MSWLGKLLGTDKVINNVMDKDNGLLSQVGGWIGNMDFTEEERAKMNERMVEGVGSFVKLTLSENTERSKARRMVAKAWIYSQLAMIFITMLTAPLNMELAKFYFSITFGTVMIGGTFSIIAFFFGAHMLSSHMGFGSKSKQEK